MITTRKRSIEDPCAAYDSLLDIWKRSRAIIRGERYVKALDYMGKADPILLPFSPSMTIEQYNFYKNEAELPGIVAEFAKVLVGGLLRKKPQITYNVDVPEEAKKWISDSIAMDGSSLIALLDEALFEEIQTSRAWIHVEYPQIDQAKSTNMTKSDWDQVRPYPIVLMAENVINWQKTLHNGKVSLSRVVIRGYSETYEEDSVHPISTDTIWVHELVDGKYQIKVYHAREEPVKVLGGTTQTPTGNPGFSLVETIEPKSHGEAMTLIPIWPLNGSIEASEPMLTPLVDKECALYNKMSRRNHLLYGAATYTPYVTSDMLAEEFNTIVQSGLGSWFQLRAGDTAGVLETPTEALKDYDRAILAAIDEMARMGIKMLAPEIAQSGVALEIRNASQTAQLGTLNVKISSTMADIIAHLINRRYNLQLTRDNVIFSLSADFSPVPLGADWLRLVGEWYQAGIIPRETFIMLLKANDLVEPDYDDDKAQADINSDELIQANDQQQSAGIQRKPKQPIAAD